MIKTPSLVVLVLLLSLSGKAQDPLETTPKAELFGG